MSFAVFVDGSANLPKELLDGIQVLPCTYTVDGKTETYDGNLEKFDAHTFYEGLRHGKVVQTSLLNTHVFLTHFEPVLAAGQDLIYVAMSSGISGTYGAAKVAAMELMEQYPDRFIHIVDSYGCGFGNGLLAVRAARFSREGMDVREAAKALDERYIFSRSEGFGDEIKRRIMLGSFVLSQGYYDAYYKKAVTAKQLITKAFEKAFKRYDFILSPVAPDTAPVLGESLGNPLKMYLSDIYTVTANLAGIPAVSLPCGYDGNGMPVGIQLMAKRFGEADLLSAATAFGKEADL